MSFCQSNLVKIQSATAHLSSSFFLLPIPSPVRNLGTAWRLSVGHISGRHASACPCRLLLARPRPYLQPADALFLISLTRPSHLPPCAVRSRATMANSCRPRLVPFRLVVPRAPSPSPLPSPARGQASPRSNRPESAQSPPASIGAARSSCSPSTPPLQTTSARAEPRNGSLSAH